MNKRELLRQLKNPKLYELVQEGTDWNLYRHLHRWNYVILDLMTNDTITMESEDVFDVFELMYRAVDIESIKIKTFKKKDYY